MSDTRRLDRETARLAADRDSRAEALLVDGLDRYFAGDFDDAIHIWTRVLFLDRSHARARAYIDRARTALGERQRRADEMLQAAQELVAARDFDRARSLVSQVARVSVDDGRLAQLWSELERAERSHGPSTAPIARQAARVAAIPVWRPAPGVLSTFLAAVALGALVMAAVLSPAAQQWLAGGATAEPASSGSKLEAPVVLSRQDVALLRARTWYAHGRLAQALRVLDEITSDEARGVADALRVEIQAALVATAGDPSGWVPAAGSEAGR